MLGSRDALLRHENNKVSYSLPPIFILHKEKKNIFQEYGVVYVEKANTESNPKTLLTVLVSKLPEESLLKLSCDYSLVSQYILQKELMPTLVKDFDKGSIGGPTRLSRNAFEVDLKNKDGSMTTLLYMVDQGLVINITIRYIEGSEFEYGTNLQRLIYDSISIGNQSICETNKLTKCQPDAWRRRLPKC